jgi:uncharacterized membrane protein
MDIIQVLVVLVVVGVVLWLVQTYIPMAPPIKSIITIVVVLFLCIWLLGVFGIGHYFVGSRGTP